VNPDRLLKHRLREVFVVTMEGGAAFKGLLYSLDQRSVILREAEAMAAGTDGRHVPVDGELILPRERISYMQRP
jgi:hypothetical protein